MCLQPHSFLFSSFMFSDRSFPDSANRTVCGSAAHFFGSKAGAITAGSSPLLLCVADGRSSLSDVFPGSRSDWRFFLSCRFLP